MPDTFLKLPEMCARYHVSDRRAPDIVRQNAVRVLRPGRAWLFDERAETALREATRMFQDPVSKEKRRRAAMRVPSSDDAYERVLALTARHRKKPGCGQVKA